MILTLPFSRARDLNSSSSPARTVRSFIDRWTICKALGDLVGVGRRAVPAEQELADVGRHGVLAAELLGQVLADEVALEHLGGKLVELVERRSSVLPDDDLALGKDLAVERDKDQVGTLALVLLVGHEKRHLAGARRLLRLLSDARLRRPPAGRAGRRCTLSVTPLNSIGTAARAT